MEKGTSVRGYVSSRRSRILIRLFVASFIGCVVSFGMMALALWADPLFRPEPDTPFARLTRALLTFKMDDGIGRSTLTYLAFWAPGILGAVGYLRMCEVVEQWRVVRSARFMSDGLARSTSKSAGASAALLVGDNKDVSAPAAHRKRDWLAFVCRAMLALMIGVAIGLAIFLLTSFVSDRVPMSLVPPGFISLVYSDALTYPLDYQVSGAFELIVICLAELTFVAPACLCFLWTGARRRVVAGVPLCDRCGYCLVGLELRVCPECGMAIASTDPDVQPS